MTESDSPVPPLPPVISASGTIGRDDGEWRIFAFEYRSFLSVAISKSEEIVPIERQGTRLNGEGDE